MTLGFKGLKAISHNLWSVWPLETKIVTKRDIDTFEFVQQWFTKRMNGLCNLSYSCPLPVGSAWLGLGSLYTVRVSKLTW